VYYFMKYREKLLKLINEGTAQEFQEWLLSQPALDQPAIMRELKQLGDLPPEEGGGNILDTFEGFKAYDTVTDKYEDAVLEPTLAQPQSVMGEGEVTNAVRRMRQTHPHLRARVTESTLHNAPNASLMRSLAQKIIALDNMDNSYTPENWKQLPDA